MGAFLNPPPTARMMIIYLDLCLAAQIQALNPPPCSGRFKTCSCKGAYLRLHRIEVYLFFYVAIETSQIVSWLFHS